MITQITRPVIPVCLKKDSMWTEVGRPFVGHYDRDGKPISMWEWVQLIERTDRRYKRIARTTLVEPVNLGASLEVSTVWVGLDMGYMGGVPLIFETMVFGQGSSIDLEEL